MLHGPLSVCRKQQWYLRIDFPCPLSPLASTHKADINYNCSPQRVVESPQKPNCFLKAPFLLRLISDLATFSILIGSPRWCLADCQTTRLPYNAPPHTQTHIYTLILSRVSAQFGASSSSCPAWGSFVVALIKLHWVAFETALPRAGRTTRGCARGGERGSEMGSDSDLLWRWPTPDRQRNQTDAAIINNAMRCALRWGKPRRLGSDVGTNML